jgi:hypothetical protein
MIDLRGVLDSPDLSWSRAAFAIVVEVRGPVKEEFRGIPIPVTRATPQSAKLVCCSRRC